MSENTGLGSARDASVGPPRSRRSDIHVNPENPTTQQMRIIGKRRQAAEEKLAQHLQQVRHPERHTAENSSADQH